MVHSTLEAKFMMAWDWQDNIIVDGEFTVEKDRFIVASLGRRAIESKISHLFREGPLTLGSVPACPCKVGAIPISTNRMVPYS